MCCYVKNIFFIFFFYVSFLYSIISQEDGLEARIEKCIEEFQEKNNLATMTTRVDTTKEWVKKNTEPSDHDKIRSSKNNRCNMDYNFQNYNGGYILEQKNKKLHIQPKDSCMSGEIVIDIDSFKKTLENCIEQAKKDSNS